MKRSRLPTGERLGSTARSGRALVRWPALAAAVAVLASVLAFPVGAASACAGVVKRGGWESIVVPNFSSGPSEITDYSVGARTPNLLLATNGSVVTRSTDGGCTWRETFEATAITDVLPTAKGEIEIKAIAMPEVTASPVLLMAEERSGGVTRPRIFRSTDAGESFTSGDTGLLPTGRPEVLRVAPSSPQVAYLGVSQGDDLLDQVLATQDGGRTWTVRSDLTEAAKQQNISGFEVDPKNAFELWAWGPGGAYHSTDAGKTFSAESEMAGQMTGPVDVSRAGGGASRVAFFRALTSDMMVSMNGGNSWLSLGTPSSVDSAGHGEGLMDLVVTTRAGDIYLYLPTANAWVDLGAAPGSHDVMVARAGDATYHVRTRMTIERFVGTPPVAPPNPKPGTTVVVPSIPDLPNLQQEPAVLEGPKDELVLKPGTERTLNYTLRLAKGQRPLDLFFLVDTTGSMKKFVDGLKLSIADVVTGLSEAGIAAHVGLGEYRAYPDYFPPRTNEPNFVYKKRAELASDTDALRDALQALEYDGGGQYDAQLGALYQVATGAGQDVDPAGPAGQDVPPGQQPFFRYDAEDGGEPLRLVLNVSNEPFGQPNSRRDAIEDISDRGALTPPDIPTFEETIAQLSEKGIKQIGLELGKAPGTYEDLKRVAEGTDAVAPEGGVDCNGDGVTDIAAGQALVCALGTDVDAVSNMGPAIVNLVKALPLRESPSMNVPRGSEVVSNVTPETYDGIPLQSGQSLPFRVTYTCDGSQAGKKFPVTLQATGSDGVLAELQTAVRCAALPGAEKEEKDEKPTPPLPPAPALFIPAVLVPILPPIAPPSAPIPISEITSASSSQAQSQAQAQAQAAAAAQRQHQPQLAFAHAQGSKLEVAKEEEYQMSSFNRREPEMPPSPALVAAAAAMTFAAGMAMRRKGAFAEVRRHR